MDHPLTRKWEERLRSIFVGVDEFLENEYAGCFPLHPNRPERGTTGNVEMDGLFNVGASFSAGYGSKLGRGWVVEIYLATLTTVSKEIRLKIENEVKDLIQKELTLRFPERELRVEKDGNCLKIHGDMSLGEMHA
ncbi:MAG: hypothetical protein JEY99_00625 [Spirochaetales bacterium]|nr:hypothetical protein [Spirochaetales bacterium]